MSNPQSIIGLCKMLSPTKIGKKVLMLDDIQDPGNLGTIIRSAVAFNIDTIVISNDSVDIYNPKVVRSNQGMMFHTNIIITDTEKFIKDLKEQDYKIIGTKVTNGKDVREEYVEHNNRISNKLFPDITEDSGIVGVKLERI